MKATWGGRVGWPSAGQVLAVASAVPALALTGWLLAGVALLLLGWFGPVQMILLGVALAFLLGRYGLRRMPETVEATARQTAALLGVALIFGIFNGVLHTEQLIVRRDPATYAQYAAWLASEGTLPITIDLAAFGGPDPALRFDSVGFYGVDSTPASGDGEPRDYGDGGGRTAQQDSAPQVQPQFMPGTPIILAFGHWMGGIPGLLLMPPVLGALAVLTFGGTVARLVGARWSVLAASALAVSLPILYTSRAAFSETCSLILLFGAINLLLDARYRLRASMLGVGFLPAAPTPLPEDPGPAHGLRRWLSGAGGPPARLGRRPGKGDASPAAASAADATTDAAGRPMPDGKEPGERDPEAGRAGLVRALALTREIQAGDAKLVAALAGLIFGLALLVRIDALRDVLPVLAYAGMLIALHRYRTRRRGSARGRPDRARAATIAPGSGSRAAGTAESRALAADDAAGAAASGPAVSGPAVSGPAASDAVAAGSGQAEQGLSDRDGASGAGSSGVLAAGAGRPRPDVVSGRIGMADPGATAGEGSHRGQDVPHPDDRSSGAGSSGVLAAGASGPRSRTALGVADGARTGTRQAGGRAVDLAADVVAPDGRLGMPLLAGLLAGGGIGFLAAYLLARPYLADLSDSLLPLLAICAGVGALTVLGVALAPRLGRLAAGVVRRPSGRVARLVPGLAAGLVVAVVAGFAVRPWVQTVQRTPTTAEDLLTADFIAKTQLANGLPVDGTRLYYEESLYWLFWYVGVPAVVFATFAAAALARRLARGNDFVWLLPLAIIGWTTVTTLWRPAITPDHPFASRRLVPIIIPGLILLAAWALRWARARVRRAGHDGRRQNALLTVGALLLLVPGAVTSVGTAFSPVGRGEAAAVAGLCRSIPGNASVLIVERVTGDRFTQLVRGMCGVPTARVVVSPGSDVPPPADVTRLIARVRTAGRVPVLLAAEPSQLTDYGTPTLALHLRTRQDERSLVSPPDGTWRLSIDVWRTVPRQ